MADLRRWASVDPGPFRFGESHAEDWSGRLSHLSDAELLELIRMKLMDRLPAWRRRTLWGDQLRWFEQYAPRFPEIVEELTAEELERLGGPGHPIRLGA